MARMQMIAPDLLKVVQDLGPEEFDAFLAQALSLRSRPRAAMLSPKESKLITRINRGLPDEVCSRYTQLSRKREKRTLTSNEHAELLNLTDEVESRDAERAAALLQLAKLRRVPIRVLMTSMGIQAAPLHG